MRNTTKIDSLKVAFFRYTLLMEAFPINPVQLSHILVRSFDLDELQAFCFDYLEEINYEDLTGGVTSRAIQLVKLFEQRRQLPKLALAVMDTRPKAVNKEDFGKEPALNSEQTPGHPPYKGLDYFDEDDADQFFGREKLTAVLINHLTKNPFLAVIGASGSGKSSLVRAGLLPSLKGKKELKKGIRLPAQSYQWLYRTLTPTDKPLASLAQVLSSEATPPPQNEQLKHEMSQRLDEMRALVQSHQATHLTPLLAQLEASLTKPAPELATAATLQKRFADDTGALAAQIDQLLQMHHAPRLLLYIDQFEELFTQCKDEIARQQFIENLLTAVHSNQSLTVVITLRADFYAQCAQHDGLRQIISEQQAFIGAMNLDELRRAIVSPAERQGWRFDKGLVDIILDDIKGEPGALPLLSHALLETWQQREYSTMTLAGYIRSGGIRGAIAETADQVLHEQLTAEQQEIARRIFLRLTEIGEGTEDTRRRAPLSELAQLPVATDLVNGVLEKLVSARLIIKSEETAEVAHEALIREWPQLRQWLDEGREGLLVQRALSKAAQTWEAMDRDTGVLYRGSRLAQAQQWVQTHQIQLDGLALEFLQTSQDVIDAEIREKEEAQRREAELLRLSLARQWAAQSAIQLGRGEAELALLLAVESAKKKEIPEAFTAVRNALANPRSTARRLITGNPGIHFICTNQKKDQMLVCYTFNLIQLWDLKNHEILFEMEHENHARHAQWNHDESKILTGSSDNTAKIWDAITGKQLLSIETEGDAQQVAWHPNDSQFLTVHPREQEVVVWNAVRGERVATLSHDGLVETAVWDADGNHILVASRDNTATIWAVATVEKVGVFEHDEFVQTAVWSADESRVLTASYDGTARIWNVKTGEELYRMSHDLGIKMAIWHEEEGETERLIATGGLDGLTKIYRHQEEPYDWETQEHILRHDEAIMRLEWHDEGQSLLTIAGNTVYLWDVGSGRLRSSWTHRQSVKHAVWNADNSHLYTAGFGGLWHYQLDCYELPSLHYPNDIDRVIWNPKGDRVLLFGEAQIGVWQPHSGQLLWQMELGHYIQDAGWNGDGDCVIVNSQSVDPTVFEADSGKVIHMFTDQGMDSHQPVVWQTEQNRIAFANEAHEVRVWDGVTGAQLAVLSHDAPIEHLVWHENGEQLLTVSGEGKVKVWEITAVQPTHTIQLENFETLAMGQGHISWHIAQNRLSINSGNWELSTGKAYPDLITLYEENSIWYPQWNKTGDKLAASIYGNQALVYDFSTKHTRRMQHQGMVKSCVFNQDESQLLTTADDKTVRLWEIATGVEALSWQFANEVSYAGWNPDESQIWVIEGRTLWQYFVKMDDLLTAVIPRLPRQMTQQEWDRYMMDEPYREIN